MKLKKQILSAALSISMLLLIPINASAITTTVCPGVGCLDIATGGQGSIGIQITGTWVGTITFKGSLGNTPTSTFTDLLVMPVGSTTAVATTTANGVWTAPIAGINQVRVVFTAFVSGTANPVYRLTTAAKNLITVPGGAGGFGTQTANTIFSGPTTGAAAAPTFRLLVAADLGTTLAPTFGNVTIGATSYLSWTGRALFRSPADGTLTINNQGESVGSTIKVDALPTVASGFGAVTPTIIAGSTPFAGAVDVGTGLVATSGVINFNGTAFPVAPFCTCQDSDSITAGVCKAKASTTQLTITTTVAATASDDIQWICVGPK